MSSLGEADYGCFASAFLTTVLIMAAVRAFVFGRPLVENALVELAIYVGVATLNATMAMLLVRRSRAYLATPNKPPAPRAGGVKRKTR